MRSANQFPLQQKGIYRNLPTFDPSITGLTAIIAGATGISGFNTIRCLLESPHRWSKVYALSRSPPSDQLLGLLEPSQRESLHHVPVDLLSSAEEVANSLRSASVTGTHVFFYAYIQPKADGDKGIWENAEKLVECNSKILNNFLETKWNVIRPFGVLGTSDNAKMNTLYVLGAYAATQRQNQVPLSFPGGWELWEEPFPVSTARLTGYLTEWAVLEDACENQAFNSEDGNMLSWDRYFHELARWFGIDKGVAGPREDVDQLEKLEIKGGRGSALGYGPSTQVTQSFNFLTWAKDPSNARAWEEIMKQSQHKIKKNPFEQDTYDTFGLGKYLFVLTATVSMSKARRLGWTGQVDSLESSFEALSEMASLDRLKSKGEVDVKSPLLPFRPAPWGYTPVKTKASTTTTTTTPPSFPSAPPATTHELDGWFAFKTPSSKKSKLSRKDPLDSNDSTSPSPGSVLPSCEVDDDPALSFSAASGSVFIAAYASSAGLSSGASVYANLSIRSDRGGDETGPALTLARSQSPLRLSHLAIMHGDADLTQRSSSLTRRASSMDPENDADKNRDVDTAPSQSLLNHPPACCHEP
ncbi:NAD dependent epimerase dehydratase [Fusarium heterosporum]|uniref:NAD dependent epimerase dehydratase n=1 Tax=Fusarium heterosporum TaxID=42747 RepID=A0A8H5TSY5_FUSHE|nr:NAD dependent epimerase dehydratase [Fusarium heterosporum]